MRHGHRLLIGALVAVVLLALTLALLTAGGQGALAQGIIIYVDVDATGGANNGTSWANAYTDLQDALNLAGTGDQIWVAAGTYKPTSGTDRTISFRMKNGVAIYGGFAGTESQLQQRDWVANLTVLSGDLNGDDLIDFVNYSENSFHVFYHPAGMNLNSTAVLDGFTIRGGNATGNPPHNLGGGIYNGGGSSPALTNCAFLENAAGDGGGMANDASSPTLTNCTFWYNYALGGFVGPEGGAGMWNTNGSAPALMNCTFSKNTVGFSGSGAMYNSDSTPTLTNCILWGDHSPEIGNSNSSPIITYSDVQGSYFGTGNIDEDPLFVDMEYGDLHLGEGSPCIDAGTNAGAPATDYDGDPRPIDGDDSGTAVADMGADEAPLYVAVSIDPNTGSTSHNVAHTGRRELPVAILTTEAFDVARVVVDSVLFAGASAISFEYEDVDEDDDLDLLLVFKVQDMVDYEEDSTVLILTGVTDEGTLIQGTVELTAHPGKGPK